MRSRYLLVAPIAAAIAIGSSWSAPDAAPTHSPRARHDDPRRSGRALRHGLQLGHRACARRAPAHAADGRVRFEVHGHRRDRESGDGALPVADRAGTRERPRTELRIRSPRTRQVAAQVRRSRGHARANGAEGRIDAAGRGQGRAPELQQRAGLAHRQGDRDRHARRSHPVPRAARQSLQPPDAHLDAAERRCAGTSRRGVVPRRQAGLERRLRA